MGPILLIATLLALPAFAVPEGGNFQYDILSFSPGFYLLVLGLSFFCLIGEWLLLLNADMAKDCAEVFSEAENTTLELESPEVATVHTNGNNKVLDVDIIIVGAGPSGLSLALALSSFKSIRVVLVEKRNGIIPDSRFLGCNSRTMEDMRRLGVAEDFVKHGESSLHPYGGAMIRGNLATGDVMTLIQGRCRADACHLGSESDGNDEAVSLASKWASEYSQRVAQSVQEACLLRKLSTAENVQILYGWEAKNIHITQENKVHCALEAAGNDPEKCIVRATYIAGCDGPSSIVSKTMKIRYDGLVKLRSSHSLFFKSPDLTDLLQARGVMCQQMVAFVGGIGVGSFTSVDSNKSLFVFHLAGLVGGDPGELSPDDMGGVFEKFLGDIPYEKITIGRWRWNFLVAQSFRIGPAFVVGDAAHAWPPFGGLGGNNAYADSMNLGWKLGAVLSGWAGADLLDSYNIERREAILRTAISVAGMVVSPRRALMAMRLLYKRAFEWIVLSKWFMSNAGVRTQHFALEGLFLGQRYDYSGLTINAAESDVPEDPSCIYVPKVIPGSRVLHVRFSEKQSLQDFISLTSFTCFVCRTDGTYAAESLKTAFDEFSAPISVVDISSQLLECVGQRNIQASAIWMKYLVVVCRPDLFVSYVLEPTSSFEYKDAKQVAAQLLCRSQDPLVLKDTTAWFRKRFLDLLFPLKKLFFTAEWIESKTYQESKGTKQEVVGSDGNEQLYKIAEQFRSVERTTFICDGCKKEVPREIAVSVNEFLVHPDCLELVRKDQGCAECQGALFGDDRILFNGRPVHARCLALYRKKKTFPK